jgi:hypothetical protein
MRRRIECKNLRRTKLLAGGLEATPSASIEEKRNSKPRNGKVPAKYRNAKREKK